MIKTQKWFYIHILCLLVFNHDLTNLIHAFVDYNSKVHSIPKTINLPTIHSKTSIQNILTNNHKGPTHLKERLSTKCFSKPKILCNEDKDVSILPLMQLCSAHFTSQALRVIVKLSIPDIIGNDTKTMKDILDEVKERTKTCNEDALLRCMRLLSSVGIFEEYDHASITSNSNNNDEDENEEYPMKNIAFRLTNTGALLQSKKKNLPLDQPSMVSCVHHWMEDPLWNAWLHLPDFIAGIEEDFSLKEGELWTENTNMDINGKNKKNQHNSHKRGILPFDRANGISSDDYYSNDTKSLSYANEFVRFVHDTEINAVLHGYDWESLSGKTMVDIGGHNGKVMGAIVQEYPSIHCKCLDLPEVIKSVPESSIPRGVELIPGDMLDPSTIPSCDVIFMKHILDKSMWNKQESISILKSCHEALSDDGKIIIADAVLPNIGKCNQNPNNKNPDMECNQMQLFMDTMYVLVGRGRQRTQMEWSQLASDGGFQIESVQFISQSPSCSMIVLTKV